MKPVKPLLLLPLFAIVAFSSSVPQAHAVDPCSTIYRYPYYYYCRTDPSTGWTYYQKFPGQTMSMVNTGVSGSNQSQNNLACIQQNIDRYPECPEAVSAYCNGNKAGADAMALFCVFVQVGPCLLYGC